MKNMYLNTLVCTSGYAYHSGQMVNDKAGTTAAKCLDQCNLSNDCKFWDFGYTICRLRSNDGDGPEVDKSFTSGMKYCTLGRSIS